MDAILANYADGGEKDSVEQAIVQVVEEIVGPHVTLPAITIVKKQLTLDIVKQMHVFGHVFEAVPRGGAVANSDAVIAANTTWFVALYKSADKV